MKPILAALIAVCACVAPAEDANTIVIKNDFVQRVLKKDGDVWRTVRFARADGSDAIEVQSDEFHILPVGSEKGWTVSDYEYHGKPDIREANENASGRKNFIFRYARKDKASKAPPSVEVSYSIGTDALIRKYVVVNYLNPNDSIDRLQVERFSTATPASRGGRGEPVFCGAWFFGLEYPAAINQCNGNPPTRPYDKLGNHSFINLDGREKEFEPRDGLISLAHFPGKAVESLLHWGGDPIPDACIAGKAAVAGVGKKGDPMELAFFDYLNTIRRPVRSFIHYNNWYDGTGKNLKPANFVDKIAHEFKTKMEPYGVKVDAFVPDNGWQNRNSIWQPNAGHFPEGMKSFAELGAALKKEGTALGLWFTLNGYELNTGWGVQNGYFEAQRNAHFSRFNRYYSLGDPHYNAELRKQLGALIKEGQLEYIKHDFNDMCDMGPHNGTLPTDRHGHEKAVDETLSILADERRINPNIFQNVTNWAWFSPWWLQHCNTIWMLSDDTGLNRKWPALSGWQMAITYRDAHLFKAWGDPATRPLVPISHLMTHGIVNASHSDGAMTEPLRDWADYVLMYYARGVQLKEWYITPSKMDDAHWKVLGELSKWAQENSATLANAIYIGGTPEKGEAHGYVAWNGDKGIVVVRNPDIKTQTIKVPFDKTVWYRGENGRKFEGELGRTEISGQAFTVKVPGWSVKVIELEPCGIKSSEHELLPNAAFTITNKTQSDSGVAFDLFVPRDDPAMTLCELVLLARDGELCAVKIDGAAAVFKHANNGPAWKTASVDLLGQQGKTVRVELTGAGGGIFPAASGENAMWLLADRLRVPQAVKDVGVRFEKDFRVEVRETQELIPATKFKAVGTTMVTPGQLAAATAAKLHIELFGSDRWQFANKKLMLNGEAVLTLPANKHGDNWESFVLDLPADAVKKVALSNALVVTNPLGDKFKLRNVALAVKLADGTWAASGTDARVFCHDKEWAHFEGTAFNAKGESGEMRADFWAGEKK